MRSSQRRIGIHSSCGIGDARVARTRALTCARGRAHYPFDRTGETPNPRCWESKETLRTCDLRSSGPRSRPLSRAGAATASRAGPRGRPRGSSRAVRGRCPSPARPPRPGHPGRVLPHRARVRRHGAAGQARRRRGLSWRAGRAGARRQRPDAGARRRRGGGHRPAAREPRLPRADRHVGTARRPHGVRPDAQCRALGLAGARPGVRNISPPFAWPG